MTERDAAADETAGSSTPASYAAAGVDIDAGERAVELIAPHAKRASRPEVLGGIGGFSGLFALKGNYREPVLAAASDGVGTKLAVAQAIDKHDTVGRDLVAMCVDDLVVCGAEPLFLQDYIAVGKVVPETVAELVGGIAEGCVRAGCALLGGETAEHPGLMAEGEYDLSATGVGVVEADEVLGPDNVRAGDVVIAMKSSGLHSNGYSLARKVLLDWGHMDLGGYVEEFGRTLGEELLEPTRIYTRALLDLVRSDDVDVHALSHVTGGGLAANLARVLPQGTIARVDRASWTPPPIFTLVGELGAVPRTDLERTLNMGIGFVAALPQASVDAAIARSRAAGIDAWVLGEVSDAATTEPVAGAEVVQGAKGVHGGAVQVVGEHV